MEKLAHKIAIEEIWDFGSVIVNVNGINITTITAVLKANVAMEDIKDDSGLIDIGDEYNDANRELR